MHSLDCENAELLLFQRNFLIIFSHSGIWTFTSVLDQYTSFTTAHQGSLDIDTSVLIEHSPIVIGSQNEFLHWQMCITMCR